jgi:membrane protease subunit HflK
VYAVGVDQQAVVRRLGAVVDDHVPPGLHVGLPWGLDRVDRLKVREQKRLTVGFEAPDALLGRPVNPARSEFFTGDENLINLDLLLQYTIRKPRAYLFGAANPTETLRQAAEASIAASIAKRPVDDLLTTGKLQVQEELRQAIQETADQYGLGIAVTAVNIQNVTPPVKVADAFRDVASAREDRDRLIKEAESYANAAVPQAQGDAARMAQEALAYRDEKTREAIGDANRFTQAYEAYKRSPDITETRLYLEAIEEIMPKLRVITVDPKRAPVDLNLFPRAGSNAPGNAPGAGSGNAPSGASPAGPP